MPMNMYCIAYIQTKLGLSHSSRHRLNSLEPILLLH